MDRVPNESVTTPVSDDAIRAAVQPLILDVAGFDKHLYAFITSGNGDTSFSVPPDNALRHFSPGYSNLRAAWLQLDDYA